MAPFFNTSSPFDQAIEKATDEKSLNENWTLILDICERVKSTPNGSRDCLKSIVKRLNHRVPFVALQTLTILDSCVQNCGLPFHVEIANKDFISNCRVLINTKAHPKVAKVLKDLIHKWSQNEFSTNPALSNIPTFYESLKSAGYFPSHKGKDSTAKNKKASISSSPILKKKEPSSTMDADLVKEQDDFEKAIALSLLEESGRNQISTSAATSSSKNSSNPVYPGINLTGESTYKSAESTANVGFKDTKMVRALFDFEAVEDNELTFKAGEIICIIDDSDVNWWKGSNSRGEGLFPANFVTQDLNEVIIPENNTTATSKKDTKNTVEFKVEKTTNKIIIDEALIDKALTKIQNVDPSSLSQDSPETMADEQHCVAMQPLIDSDLQHIDKKYNDLMELNGKVLNALQLYSSLMRETPLYGNSLNKPAYTNAIPNSQYQQTPPQYQYGSPQQPITADQSVPGVGAPQPHHLATAGLSDTSLMAIPQMPLPNDQVVPGQYPGQISQHSGAQLNTPPLNGSSGQIPAPYNPNLANEANNQNNLSNVHDYSSMFSSLPQTMPTQNPAPQ